MKQLTNLWDIFGGIIFGLLFAIASNFNLEKIQVAYSIIILVLVSMGCFRIIKQSIEKNKKNKPRKIDNLIDTQKPIKAISLAADPTKEGKRLGEALIALYKGGKRAMKKIKEILDKFKGYLLTIALGVLTIAEMCGGFINELCGEALTINGIKLVPIIILTAAIVVGCISNGFTKEQREKIKALFSKSSTNELVQAEIKKTLKEDEAKLKEFNKILVTQENALANLETELANAKNTHSAKVEMFKMTPQLATEHDVQLAANEVVNCEAKISEKKQEIAKTNASIEHLTKTINALKNQL